TSEDAGEELWKSDGTTAGTTIVKDICPGAGSSSPQELIAVGSRLFFFADDCSFGREPWSSDGPAAGTTMSKDLRPGGLSSITTVSGEGTSAAVADGVLYFVAYDDAHGFEPWRSDGSADGTTMIAETIPGSDSELRSDTQFAALGDKIYFGGANL